MVRKSTGRKKTSRTRRNSASLSPRTRKAIDTLPSHAQQIYKKAHTNALKQYKSPTKRRGGRLQSKEQVAHKVAWSAVKKAGYKKAKGSWEKD
jgi:cation transport regulator